MVSLVLTRDSGVHTGSQNQHSKWNPHKPTLSPSQMRRHALQPLSLNQFSTSRHGLTNAATLDTPEQLDPASTPPIYTRTTSHTRIGSLVLTRDSGVHTGSQNQHSKWNPHKPTLSPSQMRRHALQPLSPNQFSTSRHGLTNAATLDTPEQPDPASTSPISLPAPCLCSKPETLTRSPIRKTQKRDYTVESASSVVPHKSASQSLETTPSKPSLIPPKSFKFPYSPTLLHSLDGPSPNTSYNDDHTTHLSMTEIHSSSNANIDWSTSAFSPKPRPSDINQSPCSKQKRESLNLLYKRRNFRDTMKWANDVAKSSKSPCDEAINAAQVYGSLACLHEEEPVPGFPPATEHQPEADITSVAVHSLSNDNILPSGTTISEERQPMSTPLDWDINICVSQINDETESEHVCGISSPADSPPPGIRTRRHKQSSI